MRIVHDTNVCASIGMCESLAPDYFEIKDDGALHVLNAKPAEADRDIVDEAVRSCPTGALHIEED